MRNVVTMFALLACAAPAAAQQHNHGQGHSHGQGQAHAHGAGHQHEMGVLPTGWKARLDRADAKMDNVHFMAMDGGYHAILGPAALFYRQADQARGAYTVQARFNQRKAPNHPEAYGLFVGGRALEGQAQEYLYFLVRGDGKYSVRHRAGSEVHTIRDWTAHPAVVRQDSAGKASNRVAVQVRPSGVAMMVNGTEVASFPRAQLNGMRTDGTYGLRVNHNLDVLIDQYSRR
jgi:hypothetical protein